MIDNDADINLPPLQARRNVAAVCYGYKLCGGLLPRLLIPHKPIVLAHDHQTRWPRLLLPTVDYPTSRWLDRSPLVFATKLFNCLPPVIRALRTLESFKQAVWDKAPQHFFVVNF